MVNSKWLKSSSLDYLTNRHYQSVSQTREHARVKPSVVVTEEEPVCCCSSAEPSDSSPRFVAFISGLSFGDPRCDSLATQLLADYLTGSVADSKVR